MLYKQIVNRHEFPLELRAPNVATKIAFDKIDSDKGKLETFTSFNKL